MTSARRPSGYRNYEHLPSYGKIEPLIPRLVPDKRPNSVSSAVRRAPPKNLPKRTPPSARPYSQIPATMTKEQTIESLQKKLSTVQSEMEKLLKENSRLSNHLQSSAVYTRDLVMEPPGPKSYALIENRLHQYCQSTKNFERQLAEMETSVKAMKDELSEVRSKRVDSVRSPRVSFAAPSSTPCVTGSRTRSPRLVRLSLPRQGMVRHLPVVTKSNTDQPMLDLKEQYSKLKNDFKLQTEELVHKIHNQLDSLRK